MTRRWFGLAVFSVLLGNAALMAGAESRIRIERTWLPDAAPSAFAVGFPNGVGFCYDPVRGGLNYIWIGGFPDVSGVWPDAGKLIHPAQPTGTIVYREQGAAPLRRGGADRVIACEFKGYRLLPEAIEFRYLLDGVLVREQFRAVTGGLERKFVVTAPGGKFWYLPGERSGAALSAHGAQPERDGFVAGLPAGGGEFVLTYRWEAASK